MVRGRRVRAVVACSRDDECCSPLPKRKDLGTLHGKLSHTVLNATNKNQTITQFFQSVEVEIDESSPLVEELVAQNEKICLSDIPSDEPNDLDDKEKEEFKEIITTPNIKGKQLDLLIGDILSPPTPHRIEYCLEEEEEKIKNGKAAQAVLSAKKIVPAPKARRRLNNNQTANQQAAPKPIKPNTKLTEFFPVRRSVRKASKIVLEEKQRTLEDMLRKGTEQGLRVCNFEGKGRGVVANKMFDRGDYVVEYSGDLIDIPEAKRRELKYAQDQNTGCYMYYFKHKGQQYCIDATAETGRLGRLVNHSRYGNLITRTIDVDNMPRLVLIAKDTIEIGEEVTYDYGDRSKESLRHHPWLAY